jgi:hypothetical protein
MLDRQVAYFNFFVLTAAVGRTTPDLHCAGVTTRSLEIHSNPTSTPRVLENTIIHRPRELVSVDVIMASKGNAKLVCADFM